MIDLATNLIAGSSHIQETLVDLRRQKERVSDEEMEGILKDISLLEIMDLEMLSIRRDLMNKMLSLYNAESEENKYWCLAKHIFASYGLAGELIQSDYQDEFFKTIFDRIFDLLLKGLYLFLNLEEVPTCSRCLADKLKT